MSATSERGRTLAVAYAAAVSFADAQVGRVLDALQRQGGENTTLTILLSDHGWKLGHHGGWGKHTLMAADTHVPLIIRAPGFPPKRVHAPVELIDVYPTLCELARLPWRGRSTRKRGEGRGASESTAAAGSVGADEAWLSAGEKAAAGGGDDEGRRLGRRRRSATVAPPLEGRSLVPLMRRPSPRAFVARSAALSQWTIRKRAARCTGYALRTQGWLLIQWAADEPRATSGKPSAAVEGRACEAHSDLFRVARNESRQGVLREVLIASGGRRAVRRSLQRRLKRLSAV